MPERTTPPQHVQPQAPQTPEVERTETIRTQETTRTETARDADVGQKEVQQRFDKEQAQGFVGVEVDPTPNENYTVQGVTSGAPTPESDPELAAKVGSSKFVGSRAEAERRQVSQ